MLRRQGLEAWVQAGLRWVGPDCRLPTSGPVTNATIMLAPVSMLSSDFRPSLPLPHFNKHLLGAEHGDEPHHGGLTLRLGLHQQVRLFPSTPPPQVLPPLCPLGGPGLAQTPQCGSVFPGGWGPG